MFDKVYISVRLMCDVQEHLWLRVLQPRCAAAWIFRGLVPKSGDQYGMAVSVG